MKDSEINRLRELNKLLETELKLFINIYHFFQCKLN